MKNKKLFAILTLVCFMFTLMPVAAFAAETPVYVYDSEQVYVTGTKDKVTDEDTEATVAPKKPFYAYVGSADGKSVTASNYVFYVVDEDGEYVDVALGGEFAGFKVEGDYTVYAINVEEDAAKVKTDVLDKIASVESKVDTIKAWAGANNLVSGEAVVTVEDAADYEYEITLSKYVKASEGYKAENSTLTAAKEAGEWTMTIAANDGFKKDGAVVATLEKYAVDKDGKEIKDTRAVVKNVELKISEAGYVDVAYDTLKTNNKGQVVFEVTADYANKGNKVIVKYDDAKATVTVDSTNGVATSVVLNNEPAAPQNNENDVVKANVEFKFADANGVAVDYVGYTAKIPADKVAFTIVEKPAKSNMKAEKFALLKQYEPGTSVDTDGVYTLVYEDGSEKGFDKDGTYVIKVALENGSSATATVKVAEMGDVVGIMFVKGDKTVAYGDAAWAGAVVAVDANGVTDATITVDSLSASGLAIEKFHTSAVLNDKKEVVYKPGTVVIANDDKYIGSKVTVMAVYEDFTATTELTVVDKAATIAYLSNTAEVGISTKLTGQIKDAEGKVSNVANPTVKAIILDKPENAVATANVIYDDANKVVVLTFLASAPGEYKVQTIATYGDNNTYVSGIETITVAGGVNAFKDVVVVSMGADKMIVNNEVVALDVAPFIENSRTMMQFNVLYVFGIYVNWVAETQSIVAEGNGLKVVMQLGSKVATVNGAEVALDVAPYTVNGRTVVPVGFITGLLDITPTFTYNADGTIADILFTK